MSAPEHDVSVEPLSPNAFAPFGDVISAGLRSGTAANQGTSVRFDWSADLVNRRASARPNLSVFRSQPQALPLHLRVLERHPHSTQAFLPLVCVRFLVCVAPTRPDGEPDLQRLRAFECRPGQGINYRPGVWHHGIVALDAPAEFAMLAWEDGTSGDCEERRVDGVTVF
ncbi:MAG: ureidoglycolate lyase [Myxococcaceae bacterium]